jgi:hypothetical protein
LRAHQRVDVLDRLNGGVLGRCRPRHGDQRFPGRVRNEMQMKKTGSARWHEWPVNQWGDKGAAIGETVPAASSV